MKKSNTNTNAQTANVQSKKAQKAQNVEIVEDVVVEVVEVVETTKAPRKTTEDKVKELENAICANYNIELTDLLRYAVKNKSKKVTSVAFYEKLIINLVLGKVKF